MQYSTHLFRHLRYTIGRNINAARLERKMTLRDLSKITFLSEDILDRYELGKGEIPLNALFRIACALGTSVGELMA
jgi:transcriptional regulator with XRE-family HTH domain